MIDPEAAKKAKEDALTENSEKEARGGDPVNDILSIGGLLARNGGETEELKLRLPFLHKNRFEKRLDFLTKSYWF